MIQNEKDAFFAQYAHNTDKAVLEIIWQAKQSKAISLNLGGFHILDLSPFKDLINLQNLIIHFGKVNDLNPLKDLVNLNELVLSHSEVSDLNPLKNLVNLKRLTFHYSKISDLSPLKDLTNLKWLICHISKVKDLSPLKDLVNLEHLDVSESQLVDLSPLKNLVNLQHLDISENQLVDLSPLKNLVNLQHLNVNKTQVSDLSPVKDLSNLQMLSIINTYVSDLSSLKGLVNLQRLYITDIRVSDFTQLKGLINLQELFVSNTRISDLSLLKDLVNLQHLFIPYAHVSDLSPLRDLANLQKLSIQFNPIQYIPQEIYHQWECAKDLKAYWQDQKQSQTTLNNQLKIMFLGNGCVGKTTLLHWFLDNQFKDLSLEDGRTHGIIIQPYKFKDSDVLAHFWDFGGQEVYHATHRLFLGRRSIYLLVWATESPDATHEERHPPQYWLDMIADIGGHERSRVLIVQNLFDGQTERNILTDAQRQDYEKRGLDITTYCINAKTGLKIKSLKSAIEEEAEQLIKTNIEELPTSWVNIRKAVADKRLAKDKTLAWAAFENICRDCELTTDPNVILGYLHRAGELFHYDNQFDNQIILDQEWALKAVYAVLKRDRIERFKGVFTLEDLREIWQKDNPNLSDEEAKIFLNFMLANKTMFYTEGSYKDYGDNPEFVVPQLLPTDKPKMYSVWQNIADKTHHRIQYAFLHRDIIERFIVATAHLSKNKDYWRNGLFINYGNDQAVVEVVEDNDIKYIHIECTGNTQTQLLKTIREEFNKIRTLDKAKEYQYQHGNWEQVTGEITHRAEDLGSGFKEKAPIFDFNKNKPISLQLTTENSMKQHLLNLIADSKLKETLDIMHQIAGSQNSYFNDDLTGYLARFNRNERENNRGILSLQDYRIEYNRLDNATKDLLNSSDFDESKVPTSFKIGEKEAIPPSENIIITKNISVPLVSQNKAQNTEIESIRKARIHFASQLKTFLDVGCTYHDFWNSNLAEDIGLCYFKMKDLFIEKYKINDFSDEKVKAMFILYGIDERSEELRKSIVFTGELPAFQRIGIDCSNGFQKWHEKYCELAEREWNQYLSNIDNYSFDFSILENNIPSVSETENPKIDIPSVLHNNKLNLKGNELYSRDTIFEKLKEFNGITENDVYFFKWLLNTSDLYMFQTELRLKIIISWVWDKKTYLSSEKLRSYFLDCAYYFLNGCVDRLVETEPTLPFVLKTEWKKKGVEEINVNRHDTPSVPKSKKALFLSKDPFNTGKLNLKEEYTEKPRNTEGGKPKVYFSYAWDGSNETGESREKIVQELYESLKADGYNVRRDKEDVGYKDSIENFMREIGRGSFIVVTISDKYLKSANCMFELLQIYRKSNSDFTEFKDKIYPIVLGDAKIYDPMDRLQYVKYWKAKKAALEKEINEIGLAETIDIIGKDYKNYKEITDNIGLISSIISDLNTLNPKLLSKNNFEEIKKAIAAKANG